MKNVFTALLVFTFASVQAQQDPNFVSEGFSPFWNNPASFGSWNRFSVNAVGSIQPNGFSQPPQRLMTNFEFAIPAGELMNTNSLFEIGGGVNFIATSHGGVRQQIFQVPLNYQIQVKNSALSFGFSPGFRRLDFSDVGWITPSPTPDPLIPDGKQATFQLDAGIFWYGERFYLGMSST